MSRTSLDLTQLFAPKSGDAGSLRRVEEPAPGFSDRLEDASAKSAASEPANRDSADNRSASSDRSGSARSGSDRNDSQTSEAADYETANVDASANSSAEVEESAVVEEAEADAVELSEEVATVVTTIVAPVLDEANVEIAADLQAVAVVEDTTGQEGEAEQSLPTPEELGATELLSQGEAKLAASEGELPADLKIADQTVSELAAEATQAIEAEKIATSEPLADGEPANQVAAAVAVDKTAEQAEGKSNVAENQPTTKPSEAAELAGGEQQGNEENKSSANRSVEQSLTESASETSDAEVERADVEEPAKPPAARSEAPPASSLAESNDNRLNLLTRIAAGRVTGGQGSASDTAPRVDASRFVSRVSGALKAAQERGGALQLRLSPPELGVLQVKITITDGVMTASMETETTAAKNILLDNLPALRERLASQEIRIDKFDVNVQDEQQRGQQPEDWQSNDRPKNESREQRRARIERSQTDSTDTNEAATTAETIGGDGAINLVA